MWWLTLSRFRTSTALKYTQWVFERFSKTEEVLIFIAVKKESTYGFENVRQNRKFLEFICEILIQ